MTSRSRKQLEKFFQVLEYDLRNFSASDEFRREAISRLDERKRKRAKLGNSKDLDLSSKNEFIRLNSLLKYKILRLSSLEIGEARSFIEKCLWADFDKSFHGPQQSIDLTDLLDGWMYGPGTSNGLPFGNTHTVDKVYLPMTVTKLCEPYVRYIRKYSHILGSIDAASGDDGISEIVGNRITTVPKNEKTRRVIAIEPSGNLCVQKAIERVVERALARIGLDITTQERKNKTLAWIGSHLDNLSTLDLSKASDSMLRDLIKTLWPEDIFKLMDASRSHVTSIDGVSYRLNMFSTMGNAFTFPVMTLTILSLIYANRRINHVCKRHWIDWSVTGVYGDDIIIPSEETDGLIDILDRAGFVVNKDKSYVSGPFRESCGGDYYKGYDITPFYVESLHSYSDIYVAWNKMLDWCSRHEVYLPQTFCYLATLCREPYIVPEWMPVDSGIRSATAPRNFKYLRFEQVPRKFRYGNAGVLPLIAGGFLESRGRLGLVYTTRECPGRYVTKKGLIPKGYQSGWDPFLGNAGESAFRASVVDFTFTSPS